MDWARARRAQPQWRRNLLERQDDQEALAVHLVGQQAPIMGRTRVGPSWRRVMPTKVAECVRSYAGTRRGRRSGSRCRCSRRRDRGRRCGRSGARERPGPCPAGEAAGCRRRRPRPRSPRWRWRYRRHRGPHRRPRRVCCLTRAPHAHGRGAVRAPILLRATWCSAPQGDGRRGQTRSRDGRPSGGGIRCECSGLVPGWPRFSEVRSESGAVPQW